MNVGEQRYYIASLKHTNRHHEHITFWGPDYRGYVLALTEGRVGRYTAEFIAQDGHLNDGETCIAVPEEAVKALLSPTPFYRGGDGVARQFYDVAGPVVDNTRANWNALIAAALPGNTYKPKPEVHRKERRSFALPAATPLPTHPQQEKQ